MPKELVNAITSKLKYRNISVDVGKRNGRHESPKCMKIKHGYTFAYIFHSGYDNMLFEKEQAEITGEK